MATFSFRAECPIDMMVFRKNALRCHAWNEFNYFDLLFGEVAVEIESDFTIDGIIDIMRLQDDSHVMIQSLRQLPASENDFSRNYSL